MKPYITFFILLITTGLSNNTMSDQHILTADYYFLKAEVHDAIVTININDAPIIKSADTDSFNTVVPMNTWLTEGENIISIDLSPPPDTSESYNPVISISVFLHDPKSETPSPKQVLATLEYRIKAGDEVKFPLTRSVQLNFNESIPNKLWTTAADIKTLSTKDKTEIISLINLLTNSLTGNNINKAIELQSFKISEEALSVNKKYSDFEHAALTTYALLEKQTGLSSKPVNLDELTFKICGKDKLVFVSRTDGTNAISFISDELDFELEVFMAKINNHWVFAR